MTFREFVDGKPIDASLAIAPGWTVTLGRERR
jgi:hypothetical protein